MRCVCCNAITTHQQFCVDCRNAGAHAEPDLAAKVYSVTCAAHGLDNHHVTFREFFERAYPPPTQ